MRSSTPSGATGGGFSSTSSSLSRPPHELIATARTPWRGLPAVVREGLVGLRHAEDVVLALVGAALLGLRVQQLVGQALRHRLLATVAGELDEPADGERASTRGGNLDRDLVGRAAYAAGADLQHGREGLDRDLEGLDRILAGALREDRQRVIDDALGGRLLPVQHHLVDDLLDKLGTVDGVRIDRPAPGGCATRHLLGLNSVLGTGLLAVRDAGGVKRAADDLVTDARKVLDAATTHEHDGVLLQVVAFAGNVNRD